MHASIADSAPQTHDNRQTASRPAPLPADEPGARMRSDLSDVSKTAHVIAFVIPRSAAGPEARLLLINGYLSGGRHFRELHSGQS